MEETCHKLQSLGFKVTIEECAELSGKDFIGRAHIAQLMVNKGYCETVKECFEKYIAMGKPAYTEKNELTAEEAIKTIKAAGGLAFLAHLNQTGFDDSELRTLLEKFKGYGLDGIEGYYTEYSPEQITQYRTIAESFSFVLSGGSDYHAEMKPHIEIGVGTGDLAIPYYVAENIKRKIND